MKFITFSFNSTLFFNLTVRIYLVFLLWQFHWLLLYNSWSNTIKNVRLRGKIRAPSAQKTRMSNMPLRNAKPSPNRVWAPVLPWVPWTSAETPPPHLPPGQGGDYSGGDFPGQRLSQGDFELGSGLQLHGWWLFMGGAAQRRGGELWVWLLLIGRVVWCVMVNGCWLMRLCGYPFWPLEWWVGLWVDRLECTSWWD